MRKKSLKEIISSQKEKLTIELLYSKNRNKGITKDFIEFLLSQNLNEVIKILSESKSTSDFSQRLKQNYQSLSTKYGAIFECLITGDIYGLFDADLNLVPLNKAEMFIKNNHQKDELQQVLNTYKKVFIDYINSHNSLKHELLKTEEISDTRVADYRKNFTEEDYNEICSILFKSYDINESYSRTYMSRFIIDLLSIYDKKTLLENFNLVSFELQYGYFDEYCELILNKKSLPSMEERLSRYNIEKDITVAERYHLTQIDLLEERIASLESPSKEEYLNKIKRIREEQDIRKKVTLLNECYEYYEKQYRRELVENIYAPSNSKEITDFTELDSVLIHVFLRNPMKKLPSYEKELRSEIISKRGVLVTGEEELTPEEQQLYQEKIDYAINVLLNPVIASESLPTESIYSDATGLRWYKSDTSNQISASIFSIDTLLSLGNCIGIGFDKTTINPDNIIISSNIYQTTNMGVDNLEVEPNLAFKSFSSPLSELKKSKRTEIVMYRKNGEVKTEAAYVFAIIGGYNEEKDKATILEAKEYAEKNNKKFIVFNIKKIKQSYDTFLSKHLEQTTSEEVTKTL